MHTSTTVAVTASVGIANVAVPLIRMIATISFAIAPISMGFVIIAFSEQLIRGIWARGPVIRIRGWRTV